ncbi:MAG: type IV secretory system conjugative DNA transfer family protein [Nocardioides sp.]|uniref:type IV secretory system conjugative DNA transfer family protein n=1 Tax=Nocardioides sp. TaxID=35761 RepID=UPI0039E5988F
MKQKVLPMPRRKRAADAGEAWVFSRLHLPRPLDAEVVEAALLRLATDRAAPPLVSEARAEPGRLIQHLVGTPVEHVRWVQRTLRHLIPGLVIAAHDEPRQPVERSARVRLRPHELALATDRAELNSLSLLAALAARFEEGERLVLQVVLGPRTSPRHLPKEIADPTQRWWQLLTKGEVPAASAVREQIDRRTGQHGFAAVVRIGVSASTAERRQQLIIGVLGALSTAEDRGTYLDLTFEPTARLNQPKLPWWWRSRLSAAELTALLSWPLGERDLPGVPPLHPRLLLPVPELTDAGGADRVVGISPLPGVPKPIMLTAAGSLFHTVVTGPTGSGKSVGVFLPLIRADIHAGRAVLVIDPKKQLIDKIIDTAIPADRVDDVVLLDPSQQQVPGFNPLDVGSRDPDVVVDGLLAVFAAVFSEGWGPRTQDITHAGLLTLARVGAMRAHQGQEPFTLLHLPQLFADEPFRRSVIGYVADDEGLGSFWAAWQAQSPQAQATALLAPSNKWRQYLMRPSVRRILGQPRPKLRLRDVFRERKIVLVPLNDGLIGPITAQLLGGLIVAEAWAATLERAAEADPTNRPASVWIDEVQNYLHLPTSLDDALAASRSMGVAWNMAHQFRSQMPPAMLAAADSNASNKVIFRPKDPRDAAAYARMAPELEALDFMALPQYEAYATLVAGGAQQPWCSLRTLPPPETTGLGDRVRAASREQYGTAAHGTAIGRASAAMERLDLVGRKRRS